MNSLEILRKDYDCATKPCPAFSCDGCEYEVSVIERKNARTDAIAVMEMVESRIKSWVRVNIVEAISVHAIEDHDCGECPFCAFPDCRELMNGKEFPDGKLADIVSKIKSNEGIE